MVNTNNFQLFRGTRTPIKDLAIPGLYYTDKCEHASHFRSDMHIMEVQAITNNLITLDVQGSSWGYIPFDKILSSDGLFLEHVKMFMEQNRLNHYISTDDLNKVVQRHMNTDILIVKNVVEGSSYKRVTNDFIIYNNAIIVSINIYNVFT